MNTDNLFPIRVPADFQVIAHRGASAYAPENTRPAFDLARTMGSRHIETDAQLTTDGLVVLCHDRTLERYGHGPALVEQQSSAHLLSLDMGAWFDPAFAGTPMMSLDELLADFAAHFTCHVELKGSSPDLARAVLDVTNRRNAIDRVIFSSFSFEQLERMRQLAPHSRLGWLVSTLDEPTLNRGRSLKLHGFNPRANALTAEQVARARSIAPSVRAWGVDGSPQEVHDLVRRAVDTGCDGTTINWPDRFAQ